MSALPIHERPVAAKGYTSYRYKGDYGYIMIGAHSIAGALSEAKRSISSPKSRDKVSVAWLDVWDDAQRKYVPALYADKSNSP
jgi:hypothetical protein